MLLWNVFVKRVPSVSLLSSLRSLKFLSFLVWLIKKLSFSRGKLSEGNLEGNFSTLDLTIFIFKKKQRQMNAEKGRKKKHGWKVRMGVRKG